MAKNIAVFSDGTGQDGGVRPEQRMSNVYKLYRVCRVGPDSDVDPKEQIAFYDAGLGTDEGSTALTAPVRFVQKMLGSLTGRGVTKNIADCYEFIVNHYEPGDRIFLIGFSRGAYTVRAVADLIRLCGVPTGIGGKPLPRFRRAIRDLADEAVVEVLEHGAGHPRADFESERDELALRFRSKYGSDHESGEACRSNVAPYFIGVFDTVAALGARGLRRRMIQVGLLAAVMVAALLPSAMLAGVIASLSPATYWPTFAVVLAVVGLGACLQLRHAQRGAVRKTIRDFPNKGDVRHHDAEWKGENFPKLLSRFVSFARSANAIDETRADFDRLPWGPGTNIKIDDEIEGHLRFEQLWFAGNHSDVGGSYPETESRLSDVALKWMVEQVTGVPHGLKIDGQSDLTDARARSRLHVHPGADGVQHCEIAGTQDRIDRLPPLLRRIIGDRNWAVKVREINPQAKVHDAVAERFELPSVPQCAGSGPYRPTALAGHERFIQYYGDRPADVPVAGRVGDEATGGGVA
jgi:hypothetical protein